MNPVPCLFRARVVQHKECFEIIEGIQDEIDVANVVLDVRGIHVVNDGFYAYSGIDALKFRCSGRRLRQILPDVFFVVEGLPLQVRRFDEVPVHDTDERHTGTNKQLCGNAAQRSGTDYRDARGGDSGLSFLPDGR